MSFLDAEREAQEGEEARVNAQLNLSEGMSVIVDVCESQLV